MCPGTRQLLTRALADMQAVQNFDLTLNEVRRIVLNGFWSSFNPWRDYEKKKQYIQQIMAYYDAVEHKYGFHRHAELRQVCSPSTAWVPLS